MNDIQNRNAEWLDEETSHLWCQWTEPLLALLDFAAIATAASIHAVPVPGALTSFVAENRGKHELTLQIKFQKQNF